MSILKEFRQFAVKGNVADLAVGVIIGAAFGKIVSSLVEDVIMPPIGRLLGDMDFSNFYLPLSEAVPKGMALAEAKKLGPVLAYGNFLSVVLNFLIVAGAIFLVVKGINALRRQEQEQPASPTEKNCPYCQSSIAIKATRCPQCTSDLGTVSPASPASPA